MLLLQKGVAHGVALEHYEKLFEALCTFESRWTKTSSIPDLASLEAQVNVECRHCWLEAVGARDCTASVHLWLYMCCVEVRGDMEGGGANCKGP